MHMSEIGSADGFEVDDETGSVYWKGKEVKTKTILELGWLEKSIAIILVLLQIVVAVLEIISKSATQ